MEIPHLNSLSLTHSEEAGSVSRGKETVLVVEDEQVVREVAASILREQGYVVIEAADGVEALGLAQTRSGKGVDLLFTDVVMPLMSGRELADRMRTHEPGIRVLFTSGYADDVIGHTGVRQQSVAFIEKPFTPVELARKVRVVFEN
jgi:CheY-like chemotaxis protein